MRDDTRTFVDDGYLGSAFFEVMPVNAGKRILARSSGQQADETSLMINVYRRGLVEGASIYLEDEYQFRCWSLRDWSTKDRFLWLMRNLIRWRAISAIDTLGISSSRSSSLPPIAAAVTGGAPVLVPSVPQLASVDPAPCRRYAMALVWCAIA